MMARNDNTAQTAHLFYPEEFSHATGPVGVNPTSQRGEISGIDSIGVGVEIVEEVNSLAVRVATYDDMLHVVEDTGQLEHGRLCGHTVGRHQGAGMMNDFFFHFVAVRKPWHWSHNDNAFIFIKLMTHC